MDKVLSAPSASLLPHSDWEQIPTKRKWGLHMAEGIGFRKNVCCSVAMSALHRKYYARVARTSRAELVRLFNLREDLVGEASLESRFFQPCSTAVGDCSASAPWINGRGSQVVRIRGQSWEWAVGKRIAAIVDNTGRDFLDFKNTYPQSIPDQNVFHGVERKSLVYWAAYKRKLVEL